MSKPWLVNIARSPEGRERARQIGLNRRTHGASRPGSALFPTYRSWQAMKRRCDSPKDSFFASYGGRGITYDPRWSRFDAFLEDMGPRPEAHTLDRIDNDGNYGPANCRWATRSEQARNRDWDPAPALAAARAAALVRTTPIVHGTKTVACLRCGTELVVSTLALAKYCPPCRKAVNRECTARYRATHPEQIKAAHDVANARAKERRQRLAVSR